MHVQTLFMIWLGAYVNGGSKQHEDGGNVMALMF